MIDTTAVLMLSAIECKCLKAFLSLGCDYDAAAKELRRKPFTVFQHVHRACEAIGVESKSIGQEPLVLDVLSTTPPQWFELKKRERKSLITLGQKSPEPVEVEKIVEVEARPIRVPKVEDALFGGRTQIKMSEALSLLGDRRLGLMIDQGHLRIQTGGWVTRPPSTPATHS